MPYTQVLNKVIAESGLTLKEIADRCSQGEIKITPSYISTLRNDTNNRAPSDEVSRAIAEACGCKHRDLLVLEAYLDIAPKQIKALIEGIRDLTLLSTFTAVQNQFSQEQIQIVLDAIKEEPLSEFLLELGEVQLKSIFQSMNSMDMNASFHNNGGFDMNVQMKSAVGLEMKDNSMFPTIPQGSKVIPEIKEISECCDGDIIVYADRTTGENDYAIRKIVFLNAERSYVALFPINSEYPTKTCSVNDISIMGKVRQVITDI